MPTVGVQSRVDCAPTVRIAGSALRGILPQANIYAHAGINRNCIEADHDAARRVVIKIIGPHRWVACGVHGMRMAAAMGRHLDRNGILATPDCRGGVFAVFAKISPPVAHPPSPPRASPCPPLPRPLPINGWRGCVCSDVACRVAVIIIPHRDF